MKHIIRKILKEIQFNPERDRFKWRYVKTTTEPDKKIHISTFRTPTYKYIVNAEEYDNHFYFISFYPSLNKSFEIKQFKSMMKDRPYSDKYSYRTNEKVISKEDQERLSKMSEKEKEEELKKLPSMAFKIFALILSYMDEILTKDPLASFGYFGAPNIKGSGINPDDDLMNTQRFRVYKLMLDDHFKNTHTPYHKKSLSGSLYINKDAEKEFPGIVEYGNRVLQSHL